MKGLELCTLCSKEACNLFLWINKILVEGISEDNVRQAIRIREMIKQREDKIRQKRHQLDEMIYNNLRLLYK